MICKRCNSERTPYARNLCSGCFKAAQAEGKLDDYPPVVRERNLPGQGWPYRRNINKPKPEAGAQPEKPSIYGVEIVEKDLPKIDWKKIKGQTFV